MTQYKKTPSSQDTRFRNWKPARVAQLRLMLAHLKGAVDNSLAAQVAQSPGREFSEFIPRVTDITTERSYREIRLIFDTPRGLRRFLFYEMDVAQNINFNSFERFISPEPFFTFTALVPGNTYFFRIRVVTTDAQVGPFSETQEVIALRARGSSTFNNTTIINKFSTVRTSAADTFSTLLTLDHTSIGGSLFYMVNYEIRALSNQDSAHNLSWCDLEFRWLENNNQVGGFFGSTVYSVEAPPVLLTSLGDNIVVTNSSIGAFTLTGPLTTKRRGTFSQLVHPVSEGTITIELQARQIFHGTGSKDWAANGLNAADTVAKFRDGYLIVLRNMSTFEFVLDS